MLMIKLLSIFLIVNLSLQQCSQQSPGCIECHYYGNRDTFVCDKYLCNTYACGTCGSDNKTCEACVSGFEIKNGQCVQCESGCETCQFQSSGQLQCVDCYEGYYMSSTQTCDYCSNIMSYCANCTNPNGNFQCFSCAYQYGLNQKQTCQQCTPHCNSCGVSNNEFTCFECWDSYAVNGNYECEACPNGTSECYWDSNKKKLIPTQCDSDQYGINNYYLDTDKQECVICPKNCENCVYSNKKVTCTTCNFANQDQGFINKDGHCQSALSVTTNCQNATIVNNVVQCQTCSDGYEIDSESHTCQKINCDDVTENCNLCSYHYVHQNNTYVNAKYCEECAPQTYMDADQVHCRKCDVENCQSCANETACQQCQYGFYITADLTQCLPVDEKIPHCLYGHVNVGTDYPVCDQCVGYGEQGFFQQGYYLDANATVCQKCPFDGCAFCMNEYGPLFCDECKAGFYQIQNTFECKEIPIKNCAMSTSYGTGSEQQCLQCMPGYYGVNGICLKLDETLAEKILQKLDY